MQVWCEFQCGRHNSIKWVKCNMNHFPWRGWKTWLSQHAVVFSINEKRKRKTEGGGNEMKRWSRREQKNLFRKHLATWGVKSPFLGNGVRINVVAKRDSARDLLKNTFAGGFGALQQKRWSLRLAFLKLASSTFAFYISVGVIYIKFAK